MNSLPQNKQNKLSSAACSTNNDGSKPMKTLALVFPNPETHELERLGTQATAFNEFVTGLNFIRPCGFKTTRHKQLLIPEIAFDQYLAMPKEYRRLVYCKVLQEKYWFLINYDFVHKNKIVRDSVQLYNFYADLEIEEAHEAIDMIVENGTVSYTKNHNTSIKQVKKRSVNMTHSELRNPFDVMCDPEPQIPRDPIKASYLRRLLNVFRMMRLPKYFRPDPEETRELINMPHGDLWNEDYPEPNTDNDISNDISWSASKEQEDDEPSQADDISSHGDNDEWYIIDDDLNDDTVPPDDEPALPEMDMDDKDGTTKDLIQTENVVIAQNSEESADIAAPVFNATWHSLSSTEITPSYKHLTDRFTLFKTVTWKVDEDLHDESVQPIDFINTPKKRADMPMFVPFHIHQYWSGDIEFEFTLNSNKFQSGQIVCSFLYERLEGDDSRKNISNYLQQPHVILSAGSSNSARLLIPYRYHLAYLRTRKIPGQNSPLGLGTLQINDLVKLKTSEGGPRHCEFSIFVRFINSKFTGLIDGSVGIPEMDGLAPALIRGVSAMLNAPNCDQPPNLTPASYFVPNASHTMSIGTGSSIPINRLSLASSIGFKHWDDTSAERIQHVDIVSKFGYIKTITWDADDATHNTSGSLLWKTNVHPQIDKIDLQKELNDKGLTKYQVPPCSVIASMYELWRGSMEYKFDFVCTAFHTARILVAYIPGMNTDYPDITIEQARNSSHVIFDLGEVTTFTFTVPFIADRPWWKRKYGGPQGRSSIPSPSALYMFVLNPLIPMEAISKKIDIVTYVRCGEDMEFAVPVQPAIGLSYNIDNPKNSAPQVNPSHNKLIYAGNWRYLFENTKYIMRYSEVSDDTAVFDSNPKAGVKTAYIFKNPDPITIKVKEAQQGGFEHPVINYFVFWTFTDYNYAIPCISKSQATLIAIGLAKNNDINAVKDYLLDWVENTAYTGINSYTGELVYAPEVALDEFVFPEMERTEAPNIMQPTKNLPSTSSGLRTFGEDFKDLKDLCRRYQLYHRDKLTLKPGDDAAIIMPVTPQGLFLQVETAHATSNFREGPIPIIASGFRHFRGGIRFKIVLHSYRGNVWVQYRPDRNSKILEARKVGADTILKSELFKEHGSPIFIQDANINPVIEVEVPYYQPGIFGLLGNFKSKTVTEDASNFITLGDLAIGFISHATNNPISMEVFYSIADDFTFNTYVGFPPMIYVDETNAVPKPVTNDPNKEKKAIIKANVQAIKTNAINIEKTVADPEMDFVSSAMTGAVGSIFGRKLVEMKDVTVDGIKKAMAEKIVEEAKVQVDPIIKSMEEHLKSAGEDLKVAMERTVWKQSLISAVGQLMQVVLNPTPAALATAVCTMLTSLVSVSIDVGLALYNKMTTFVTEIWDKYFSQSSDLQEDARNAAPEGPVEKDPEAEANKKLNTSMFSFIFGLVTTTVGTKVREPDNYQSFTKGLRDDLGLANNAATFFRNAMEAVVWCYEWCIGANNEEAKMRQFMTKNHPSIEEWIEECHILLDSRMRKKLTRYAREANRVFDACHYGSLILQANVQNACPGGKIVLELYNKMCKLRDDIVQLGVHPDIRFEPFSIYMVGAPGIGKSHQTQKVVRNLLERVKYKTNECIIYWLVLGAKYWNGIGFPPCIARDEAYAMGGQYTDEEIAVHLAICSNSILNPPMPKVEDKDKRVNPIIYFLNSNVAFPVFTNARCPLAIYRRRKMLVFVQYAKHIRDKYPNLVEASKLPPNELVNNKHLEYYIAQDVTNPKTKWDGPYTYAQFIKIAGDKFAEHYEREQRNFKQRMIDAYALDPDFDPEDLDTSFIADLESSGESLKQRFERDKERIKEMLDQKELEREAQRNGKMRTYWNKVCEYIDKYKTYISPEMELHDESDIYELHTERYKQLVLQGHDLRKVYLLGKDIFERVWMEKKLFDHKMNKLMNTVKNVFDTKGEANLGLTDEVCCDASPAIKIHPNKTMTIEEEYTASFYGEDLGSGTISECTTEDEADEEVEKSDKFDTANEEDTIESKEAEMKRQYNRTYQLLKDLKEEVDREKDTELFAEVFDEETQKKIDELEPSVPLTIDKHKQEKEEQESQGKQKTFYNEEKRKTMHDLIDRLKLPKEVIQKLISGNNLNTMTEEDIDAFTMSLPYKEMINTKKGAKYYGWIGTHHKSIFGVEHPGSTSFAHNDETNLNKKWSNKMLTLWQHLTGTNALRSYVYWLFREAMYKDLIDTSADKIVDMKNELAKEFEYITEQFRRARYTVNKNNITYEDSIGDPYVLTNDKSLSMYYTYIALNKMSKKELQYGVCEHAKIWAENMHDTSRLSYNFNTKNLTYKDSLGLKFSQSCICECNNNTSRLFKSKLFLRAMDIIWRADHDSCGNSPFVEREDDVMKKESLTFLQKTKDWIKNWWEDYASPFISTILRFIHDYGLTIIGTIIAVWGAYKLFKPVLERPAKAAANFVGGMTVDKLFAQRAFGESANYFKEGKSPRAGRKPDAPAQKESAENDYYVERKLLNNVCFLEFDYINSDNKRRCITGRCLGIRNREIVVIKHYLEEMKSLAKKYPEHGLTIVLCRNELDSRIKLTMEDLDKVSWMKIGNEENTSNFGILTLPIRVPQFRNIVNSIATIGQHLNVRSVGDFLSHKGKTRRRIVIQEKRVLVVSKTENTTGAILDMAYQYGHHGQGLCGSLLVCENVCNGNIGIIGMHVAGRSGIGYSEPLCREWFTGYQNPHDDEDVEIMEPDLESMENADFKLEGNSMFYGCVVDKFAHHESGKSQIIPSILHGQIYEVKTEPAPLKPNDDRQPPGSHPLRDGCSKHGAGLPEPFDEGILEIVRTESRERLLNKCKNPLMKMRPLTMQEATCGSQDIPHCEALNWSSSEGFPLSTMRPKDAKNKTWLFKLEESKDGWKLKGMDKRLKNMLGLREKMRLENKVNKVVYIDCLKDARMTPDKCRKPGKTRIFSIAPVQTTIDIRRYMGLFLSGYKTNNYQLQHGIGTNCDSLDWTNLVSYLSEVGTNIVTGDYSDFGPTLATQLVIEVVEDIIFWHKENGASEEHLQHLKRLLHDEIVTPLHLSGNVINRPLNGIGSGSPITAELNSEVNKRYIKYSWIGLARKMKRGDLCSMEKFNEFVRFVTYGDDFILSVHDSVKDFFNCKTISEFLAEYGIKLTSADKKDEITPYGTLADASFLKRRFIPHPTRPGIFLAPIEEMSVTECLNWCNKNDDNREATQEVIRASLDLAFGHGPQFYEEHLRKINKAVALHGLDVTLKTWRTRDYEIFGDFMNST
uniref:Genome polyprotein n=1 Tax=Moran virus TaxID=2600337 RepID=A0A5B8XD37_9PICO|nr:polyprotein [Moran virus]